MAYKIYNLKRDCFFDFEKKKWDKGYNKNSFLTKDLDEARVYLSDFCKIIRFRAQIKITNKGIDFLIMEASK